MSQTFTMQREIKVYDDATGEFIRVGMDGDALDLVDVSQFDHLDKQVARITIPRAQAKLVAEAILEYLNTQPVLD